MCGESGRAIGRVQAFSFVAFKVQVYEFSHSHVCRLVDSSWGREIQQGSSGVLRRFCLNLAVFLVVVR